MLLVVCDKKHLIHSKDSVSGKQELYIVLQVVEEITLSADTIIENNYNDVMVGVVLL